MVFILFSLEGCCLSWAFNRDEGKSISFACVLFNAVINHITLTCTYIFLNEEDIQCNLFVFALKKTTAQCVTESALSLNRCLSVWLQATHKCMNTEGLHSICHTPCDSKLTKLSYWRHMARLPDLGKLVSSSGTSSSSSPLCVPGLFPLFVFSLQRC